MDRFHTEDLPQHNTPHLGVEFITLKTEGDKAFSPSAHLTKGSNL